MISDSIIIEFGESGRYGKTGAQWKFLARSALM